MRYFFLLVILLLIPARAWAEDTVKLKDGTVLTGTIAAKDPDGIQFYFVPTGYDTLKPQGEFSKKSFFDKNGPRWISMADVESIQFGPVLRQPEAGKPENTGNKAIG